MAGLAGLGVGGAVGGLVGALIGMGIPEYEAIRYEGHLKNGGNLLSVHCDTSDRIKRAKDLLKSSGALDIASTSESAAAATADEEEPGRLFPRFKVLGVGLPVHGSARVDGIRHGCNTRECELRARDSSMPQDRMAARL